MQNLQLTQFYFHDAQYFTDQQLSDIQQQNEEIMKIDYQYNLIIYSFPSNEYINLKDLLFFQRSQILNLSKKQLIMISIKIIEAFKLLPNKTIFYDKICTSNIWIWVSNPLSKDNNHQIQFKAIFTINKNASSEKQNEEINYLSIKTIIQEILQNTDEKLQKQLEFCKIRDIFLYILEQNFEQVDQEQIQCGSYDPKLIEDFLKNLKLNDEKFQIEFGKSYGNLLRNIILNWAIKYPTQFITQNNFKALTIKDITKKLEIDGWFCTLFERYKNFNSQMDSLIYCLQVEQALNDLEKIQNNSKIQSKFQSLNLVNLQIKNQQEFLKKMFPQQCQMENYEFILPDIIQLYNKEIDIIITHGLKVMSNFYKQPQFFSEIRIQQYKFYKIGLNKLDDILFDSLKNQNSQNNLDYQYISKEIKEKLGNFFREEIFEVLKKLAKQQNKQIASCLIYNNQNKY
ncbi:unnamed protein product [Paramecium sonneborni]|uniref:Uncharacterized protein n=1 Tax=Paramecium sonneborni TaxID=65129 RepID=A0A8S1N1H9_9CILI|nr:unnamed protein product [Paramecium sonneborni]